MSRSKGERRRKYEILSILGQPIRVIERKYEERVRKFSFLARRQFKVELCCYIYVVTLVNICQNYVRLY